MKTRYTHTKSFTRLRLFLVLSLLSLSLSSKAQYTISNFVRTPASPATLALNERVILKFNYTAPRGNLRIYAEPLYAGALAPGFAHAPSPLYGASGTFNGFITLSQPGKVDQIRVSFVDASNNTTVLARFYYNVNYTFVRFGITNITLSPASPSTLVAGSYVRVNFRYSQTWGNVRIFARPMYNGSLAPGYAATGSPIYTTPSGSASQSFTLQNNGNVNQIRFQIVDAANGSNILYTFYINVSYRFVVIARLGESDDPAPAPSVTLSPIPAVDVLTIRNQKEEGFLYQIYNLNGELLKEDKSESSEAQVNVQNFPSGTYLIRITSGSNVTEEKIIIE